MLTALEAAVQRLRRGSNLLTPVCDKNSHHFRFITSKQNAKMLTVRLNVGQVAKKLLL